MNTIDYSQYTIDDLMSAKAGIDADANPENYQALIAEIESRSDEIEQRQVEAEAASFALAEKRVKIIGWLQAAAALVIIIYALVAMVNEPQNALLLGLVAIPVILLNAFAGYTAIKEYTQWYWLSILNQALQVLSVALKSVVMNYSGIGGAYLILSWGEDAGFAAGAFFSPGFSFVIPSGSASTQSVAIDVLAVVFIVALVTVKNAKAGSPESEGQ